MSLYWSVVSSLSNVWKDKHLSIPLKVLPGSRHVCPAVYATETWIMLAFGITTWRHSIFPTTSSASPIPTAAVSGRRHPHSW